MNTINQSGLETHDEPDLSKETENPVVRKWTISGYDGGTKKRVFREPSLYLSIVVILMVTSVVLGKTPTIFWASFVVLSALAVAFHVLAERLLFQTNKENKGLAAPFEGIFVLTLGAVLPGLGLLVYGLYSIATPAHDLAEVGKLVLLLVVPLFNFFVWAAVRRKYLVHPRLVGTMNGLALGLSICWTIIWLKVLFLSHGGPSIKFGWMLLLFSAPFLLFAATCLSLDLWRKTESRIRRITTTFSALGGMLSLVFVFTPIARSMYVQSLLTEAKVGTTSQQITAVSHIRSIAAPDDLRPSMSPVSGFALGTLLIPDRGLDGGSDADRDAFFRITGNTFTFPGEKNDSDSQQSRSVGDKVAGLFLSKSQMTGTINAATLSSSIDWLFTFHNAGSETQEVRAEISLPKGAVVSRATLWIDGEPREAAFATTAKTREAYEAIVRNQRDPLLVTMPAADRVLIQCYPVPAGGGKMKILIGFKVPLEITGNNASSMQLPSLLSSNFTQPKRHRISLKTNDKPLSNPSDIVSQEMPTGYMLNGFIKSDNRDKSKTSLIVERPAALLELATRDWHSPGDRYIVQRVKEITARAPKRLFIVLDQSESLKSECAQIKNALSIIPKQLNTIVFPVAEPNPDNIEKPSKSGITLKEAQDALQMNTFVGGQDNRPVLREALEVAAEQPGNAILWIHGAQPLTQHLSESAPLDLVHSVGLYDLQIGTGLNATLQSIQTEDTSKQIRYENLDNGAIVQRLQVLVSKWQTGEKRMTVERTLSAIDPQMPVVTDRAAAEQVSCLWANDEVSRQLAADGEGIAIALAEKYRLVSSVTGAVVLESAKDYAMYRLDPGAFKAALPPASYSMASGHGYGGLAGAPVDPRYGQSNEVGQLADFGYDTARDISRCTTALSLLISIVVAGFFLKSATPCTAARVGKAVILVFTTPTIVHLVGTFLINNFGGLGGGL